MCGRFTLIDPEMVVEEFEPDEIECDLGGSRYNVAPTQKVLGLMVRSSRRILLEFQWGLVPAWARDPSMGGRMINARAETLAEKPAFKSAFQRSRCLVPADGFYEWGKRGGKKQPMWIRVDGGRPFAFAGLYEIWHPGQDDEISSCTIITTEPNHLMRTIHHRMPVILPEQTRDRWLDPDLTDQAELLGMLKPFDARRMEVRPVSDYVNSTRHDGPRCIEQVG
ncbi:MAG: SOS response-associated peptidase [Planctomycetota bacterium]|nr:MAG: SOS response-associated peptidase [Planctomycetota bacterium]